MSHWFEVFDNEQVQLMTRKQAGKLTGLGFVSFFATLALLGMGDAGYLPPWAALLMLVVLWSFVIAWTSWRLQQLRRVVWCLKISARAVVGYDYTRRKVVIAWDEVQRIELETDGLLIVGAAEVQIQIPHLYPDFSTLSHRIVHHAEINGIPVQINGQAWDEVDIYALFPFLQGDRLPPT